LIEIANTSRAALCRSLDDICIRAEGLISGKSLFDTVTLVIQRELGLQMLMA
jgi:hypothetical protein